MLRDGDRARMSSQQLAGQLDLHRSCLKELVGHWNAYAGKLKAQVNTEMHESLREHLLCLFPFESSVDPQQFTNAMAGELNWY